jgi:hypothetical protein
MAEGSFEEEEEHVLLQLHGYRGRLTDKGVAAVLEGFPERMEEDVTLRVGKTTFRGNLEPLVGTALVFSGTDVAVPLVVTRSAMLRSGAAAKPKGGGGGKKSSAGRRKRQSDDVDEEEEEEHEEESLPPVVVATPEAAGSGRTNRPQRRRKQKQHE